MFIHVKAVEGTWRTEGGRVDLEVGEEQVLQPVSVGRDGLRQLSQPAPHKGEEPQDAGL